MNLREIKGQIDQIKRNLNPFNPNEHHVSTVGTSHEKTCQKNHALKMNYNVDEQKTRGFKEMVNISDDLIAKKNKSKKKVRIDP